MFICLTAFLTTPYLNPAAMPFIIGVSIMNTIIIMIRGMIDVRRVPMSWAPVTVAGTAVSCPG